MTAIVTWVCEFCGWANDNNNGPCRKCGGQVEQQMVKGRWRRVVVKPPNTTKPVAGAAHEPETDEQGILKEDVA